MKYINKSIISALLILSIGVFSVPYGQCHDGGGWPAYPQARVNPTILLVGAFYPAVKRPRGNVITIKIRENKFYFKIESVRNLSGSQLGYSIISNLFPPELRLIGTDKMIDALLEKNIFKKPYSLKGTIYISENLLHLTDVTQGSMFDDKRKGK
ncbi:MAG: hypothetical protein FP814_00330 [Desulfobacterium sp.]|nr:hypothetical protein [Desulfobacterium sp.]MBU3946994.1 hypothetical protein [Pseudomonadota bacterium]